MESLKAFAAQKRKAAAEVYEGKKYVKRSELEAAELKCLREEEQRELEAKVCVHVCACEWDSDGTVLRVGCAATWGDEHAHTWWLWLLPHQNTLVLP